MNRPDDDFWGMTGAVLRRLDAQEKGTKERPASRPTISRNSSPPAEAVPAAPASEPAGLSKEIAGLQKLALLYHRQQQYQQAERLYQEAIIALAEALGPRDTEVARMLNNLARMLFDQGRYAEAGPLYERSLSIVEERFGKDHPKVARRLAGLAEVRFATGRNGDGHLLFQRAIQIEERGLGARHPDTVQTVKAYATILRKLGRNADAVAAEARLQDLRRGSRRRPGVPDRRLRRRRQIGINISGDQRKRNERRESATRRSNPGRRNSDMPRFRR